ncbi:hypothetical protein GCM10020358_41710 [Amorphoplanes nipponensis]|uniref:Uncharacterized protein n=1 Tax=Actinoplanes nipponensis TaxID=135950 RepID=A0A919JEP9_9ACTN|nr:hypothetical protein [Actinoplanes nipponensis]GIE47637.1 hypothetical protein Ani05nite_11710 [Actinoplanes nipponensis]
MSRTDSTRPRWVRLADTPMTTCVPVHDHRSGLCTLPDRITPPEPRPGGCHWGPTATFNCLRTDNGAREWYHLRRADRRRSRHRARHDLHAYRGEATAARRDR